MKAVLIKGNLGAVISSDISAIITGPLESISGFIGPTACVRAFTYSRAEPVVLSAFPKVDQACDERIRLVAVWEESLEN